MRLKFGYDFPDFQLSVSLFFAASRAVALARGIVFEVRKQHVGVFARKFGVSLKAQNFIADSERFYWAKLASRKAFRAVGQFQNLVVVVVVEPESAVGNCADINSDADGENLIPSPQPTFARSTCPPSASATSWCPKQIPAIFAFAANAARTKFFSRAIHSSASYALDRLPVMTYFAPASGRGVRRVLCR